MKKCLNCQCTYESTKDTCPECGNTPTNIDGYKAYSPEYAHEGGGFKVDYFKELASLENTNFWFKARNKLLVWTIGKYSHNFEKMLEIGCGTGFVLNGIAKNYPTRELTGSEIFISGLNYAASRLPGAHFIQMDARNIPYSDEFDVIGAFDVLEHIKEDELVLQETFEALKCGGYLVATVPQHEWLWSAADEHACHERRYTEKELLLKLKKSGYLVRRSTSFVTSLLPFMLISRLLNKNIDNSEYDPMAELRLPRIVNKIFYLFMTAELFLIRVGINLPIGGSRIVIAQKPDKH